MSFRRSTIQIRYCLLHFQWEIWSDLGNTKRQCLHLHEDKTFYSSVGSAKICKNKMRKTSSSFGYSSLTSALYYCEHRKKIIPVTSLIAKEIRKSIKLWMIRLKNKYQLEFDLFCFQCHTVIPVTFHPLSGLVMVLWTRKNRNLVLYLPQRWCQLYKHFYFLPRCAKSTTKTLIDLSASQCTVPLTLPCGGSALAEVYE